MELIDLEWWRCADGYELHGMGIESKSGRFEPYRPLSEFPALFDIFARKPPTAKGMLSFCNQFGALGSVIDSSPPLVRPAKTGELIDRSLELHAQMRSAVLFYELDRVPVAVARCNSCGLAKAGIHLREVSGGAIGIALVPGSLIQGLWIQFALHIASGNHLFRCEHCGTPFVVGTRTGRRNTSKYCSNACKVAAFKVRKACDLRTQKLISVGMLRRNEP